MRDQSQKVGEGTRRTGRSESTLVEGNNSGNKAWDEAGLMGMKEKEVGVLLDCNTCDTTHGVMMAGQQHLQDHAQHNKGNNTKGGMMPMSATAYAVH